ncbi:MAG TPA: hypothetical protein VLV48_10735 [Thermoanaerobaculia bacterium]|nr:hypothetical protein [Thermoanaerobaculia bacterium]
MRAFVSTLALLFVLGGCFSAPRSAHAPTTIPWADAEALVLAGQVVELESRTDGTIRLHLTDGRHLVTDAPAEGEARRLLERCGEKCANVKVRP